MILPGIGIVSSRSSSLLLLLLIIWSHLLSDCSCNDATQLTTTQSVWIGLFFLLWYSLCVRMFVYMRVCLKSAIILIIIIIINPPHNNFSLTEEWGHSQPGFNSTSRNYWIPSHSASELVRTSQIKSTVLSLDYHCNFNFAGVLLSPILFFHFF